LGKSGIYFLLSEPQSRQNEGCVDLSFLASFGKLRPRAALAMPAQVQVHVRACQCSPAAIPCLPAKRSSASVVGTNRFCLHGCCL